MFASLSRSKAEVIDTSTCREIGIHTAKMGAIPNMKSPFYIVLSNNATVSDLKKRIHGLTKMSAAHMILLFCGCVMEDDMTIPEESLESREKRSFEDDLFKPKGT